VCGAVICGVDPVDARFVRRREGGRQGQQGTKEGNCESVCFHDFMNRPLSLTKDNLGSRFLPDLNLLPF
jgi:hypothetical protein